MPVPSALENGNESHDYQRQSDECEQDVSGQNWEINPGDQAGIAGGQFADLPVIYNVPDQERGGGDQGDDHTRDMALPNVSADPKPAHRDEHSANRVERGVDRRQIVNCHCHSFTSPFARRLRLESAKLWSAVRTRTAFNTCESGVRSEPDWRYTALQRYRRMKNRCKSGLICGCVLLHQCLLLSNQPERLSRLAINRRPFDVGWRFRFCGSQSSC